MPSCLPLLFATLPGLFAFSYAQSPVSSNDTAEIPAPDISPRYWVNGTNFESLLIFPLTWFGNQQGPWFTQYGVTWSMTLVNNTNANSLPNDTIAYMSCDQEDYAGLLGPADIFRMASDTTSDSRIILLYSKTSDHCDLALSNAASSQSADVFTTVDPVAASMVEKSLSNTSEPLSARIVPDRSSQVRPGSGGGQQPGPTTAIAMIILYTITGIITLLFLVIIISGAIRAHRHPERYGPRNAGAGRPRRSRAKGIARAMLDTIPIVKFGEKEEARTKSIDIEMTSDNAQQQDKNPPTTNVQPADAVKSEPAVTASNPDGTDDQGHLGCVICTEDFSKGEEVRVLPCNHKFHPDCVDPWLLNVSGTCPLCRIDLRPKDAPEDQTILEEGPSTTSANTAQRHRSSLLGHDLVPPLSFLSIRADRDSEPTGNRRDSSNVVALRSIATNGSRAERIAALRQLRQQHRARSTEQEGRQQDDDSRRLSTRLRERFHVRTRRLGEDDEPTTSNSGGRGERQSWLGPPRATWST